MKFILCYFCVKRIHRVAVLAGDNFLIVRCESDWRMNSGSVKLAQWTLTPVATGNVIWLVWLGRLRTFYDNFRCNCAMSMSMSIVCSHPLEKCHQTSTTGLSLLKAFSFDTEWMKCWRFWRQRSLFQLRFHCVMWIMPYTVFNDMTRMRIKKQ